MNRNADESDHPTRTRAEASGISAESTLERPSAVPSLPPGSTFGPYWIIRLLGKGGMGEAYEAEQMETGRRLALKVLADPDPSQKARERFLREGRLAASLNHPNSVYVFGTEEIEGRWAIAMELVGGGTLKDRVRERGPLPPREVADTILQVIDGLEAAASAGILHRDIKPANCFLELDGTAKIGDFGLSLSTLARDRSKHQLTGSGTFLGTPAFASPEQLEGADIDVRSDIYSLGATMYYLLVGRPPFENDNLMQLLSTIAARAPRAPHLVRPEIPQGLSKLTLQCLEKQAGQRPRDYAALRAKLLEFATPAPTMRPKWLATLAGTIEMALLLGFAFWAGSSGIVAGSWWKVVSSLVAPVFLASAAIIVMPLLTTGRSLGDWMLGLRLISTSGFSASRSLFALDGLAAAASALAMGQFWALYVRSPKNTTVEIAAAGACACVFAAMLRGVLIERFLNLSRVSTGRRSRRSAEPAPAPTFDSTEALGPFRVESRTLEGGFELGYDDVLKRAVWISRSTDPTPLGALRRDMTRSTRLRWINGGQTRGSSWDAFEAPPGTALSERTRPMEWTQARHIVLKLARELVAVRADGTAPETLSLDRVWVDDAGAVKLLERTPPRTRPAEALYPSGDDREVLNFLTRVIERLVAGPGGAAFLPRSAQCFVEEVRRGSLRSVPEALPLLSVLAGGEVGSNLEAGAEPLARNAIALSPLIVQLIDTDFTWVGLAVAYLLVVSTQGGGIGQEVQLKDPLLPTRVLAVSGRHEIVGLDGRPAEGKAAFSRDLAVVGPLLMMALASYWLGLPSWLPLAVIGLGFIATYAAGVDLLGALTKTGLVPTHLPFGDGSLTLFGSGTSRAATYEVLRDILRRPEFKDFDGRDDAAWARLKAAALKKGKSGVEL